jgi:hypothetical protein
VLSSRRRQRCCLQLLPALAVASSRHQSRLVPRLSSAARACLAAARACCGVPCVPAARVHAALRMSVAPICQQHQFISALSAGVSSAMQRKARPLGGSLGARLACCFHARRVTYAVHVFDLFCTFHERNVIESHVCCAAGARACCYEPGPASQHTGARQGGSRRGWRCACTIYPCAYLCVLAVCAMQYCTPRSGACRHVPAIFANLVSH